MSKQNSSQNKNLLQILRAYTSSCPENCVATFYQTNTTLLRYLNVRELSQIIEKSVKSFLAST